MVNITGTAAARQRGAAATTEPGGSGPAALLPGTVVTNAEIRRREDARSGQGMTAGRLEGEVDGGVEGAAGHRIVPDDFIAMVSQIASRDTQSQRTTATQSNRLGQR